MKIKLDLDLLVMKKLMQETYIGSVKNAEKVRRGKPAETNEQLFNQQRAALGLRGLEPENAIEEFKNMIYGLSDKELKHKWIYEDVLRSAVRDPDYKREVERTIDLFRTSEERESLMEARAFQTMIDHDKTLRALLEMDFEEMARTNRSGDYDYASFLDEMEKNARGQESDLSNLKTAKEAITEIHGKDSAKFLG